MAVGFLGGTYFIESDLGQSYCLGAFTTGLAGAITLLVYTKLAHRDGWQPAPAVALSLAGAGSSATVSAGPTVAPLALGFLKMVESPSESKMLNSLALAAVVVAVGFLGGTYLFENNIGQSFCLGAFSTGLVGAIVLLGYTKISRVSEQRRLIGALKASEARFRAWVEHANDMITVLSPDGTIRFETPSVRRILGYEPGRTGWRSALRPGASRRCAGVERSLRTRGRESRQRGHHSVPVSAQRRLLVHP